MCSPTETRVTVTGVKATESPFHQGTVLKSGWGRRGASFRLDPDPAAWGPPRPLGSAALGPVLCLRRWGAWCCPRGCGGSRAAVRVAPRAASTSSAAPRASPCVPHPRGRRVPLPGSSLSLSLWHTCSLLFLGKERLAREVTILAPISSVQSFVPHHTSRGLEVSTFFFFFSQFCVLAANTDSSPSFPLGPWDERARACPPGQVNHLSSLHNVRLQLSGFGICFPPQHSVAKWLSAGSPQGSYFCPGHRAVHSSD